MMTDCWVLNPLHNVSADSDKEGDEEKGIKEQTNSSSKFV